MMARYTLIYVCVPEGVVICHVFIMSSSWRKLSIDNRFSGILCSSAFPQSDLYLRAMIDTPCLLWVIENIQQ